VGSGAQTNCNISETMQDTTMQGYYDALIGSRIRNFDWYKSQRP